MGQLLTSPLRFAKAIGIVFGISLLLLVLRQPLLNCAHRFFAGADRQQHRRAYTVGEIKSALSQSFRLCEALANRWGGDKTQLRQTIHDFLRDDTAVVAVEVRNANGDVVENVPFKPGTCVFPIGGLSNKTEGPVLSALDSNRLNVQRAIYVGSNVVGLLLMQRQTTVQLRSEDIADFQQHGDGGSK